MTVRNLLDTREWKTGDKAMPYITAGALIRALSDVNPDTWVCMHDGRFINVVDYEPGANEPFVKLKHIVPGSAK